MSGVMGSTGMSSLDIALLVIACVLGVTAIPTVHRMIVGPSILDRAVASDMLVVLVVAAMALYTAATGTSYAVAPMLGLTALSFVGTLSVARFVSREKHAPSSLVRKDPEAAPSADEQDVEDADPGLAPDTAAPFTEDAVGAEGTTPLPGPEDDGVGPTPRKEDER